MFSITLQGYDKSIILSSGFYARRLFGDTQLYFIHL